MLAEIPGVANVPEVIVLTQADVADPEVDLERLARLLADVLAREGVAAHAEASLTLVDPEPIARLKTEHLDGDGAPTDVLSFPIDGLDGDRTARRAPHSRSRTVWPNMRRATDVWRKS